MSTKAQPATTQTSQSSEPWSLAQPALNDALKGARALYTSDTGYKPYTGDVNAAISDQTQQAMDRMQSVANGQGGILGGLANNYAQGVINNGGISSGQAGALGILSNAANGGMGIDTNGYQNALNQMQGPSAASQYLTNIANGSDLSKPNPYLAQALEAANRRTADATNGQFSAAGRYGSGAHTDVLSRNIGEQNTNAYLQDYENARNRQLSAAGQIDSANQGLMGQRLGALSGIAGVQGQNVANRLSSAGTVSDAYAQGQNRALQTGLQGDQFTQQLYGPAQMLGMVGNFYDTRNQNQLNSTIDAYTANQARPWEMLGRLNAIATGAGQLGGTNNGTQVKPGQSQLQTLLGYGSAGLGLLGKL